MNEYANEIISVLVGSNILGPFITWFLTKRSYNAEVDSKTIQNMSDSLKFYETLLDDNAKRLTKLLELNEKLENQVTKLEAEVKDLKTKLNEQVQIM